MVIGNQYKLTFDVIATNGANYLSNPNSTNIYDTSTIGSKVFYITAQYETLYFKRFGGITDVTITNISLIEVTDDTNLPRINYDGFSYDGSGNIIPNSGCGSWLFEPQSTNLIPYSEYLTIWSNSGSTLTSGLTSPSGDNTAYSVLSGSGSSNRVQLTVSGLSVSTEHSVSVFVKKVGADNKATLIFETTETGRQGVSFNFDTKTLSNASGSTSNRQVQQLTNDWFRISYTFTTSATITSPNIQLNRSNPSQAAIYWGAQVEQQSYATSYIPTEGTTVTRNQDLCTNGGVLL